MDSEFQIPIKVPHYCQVFSPGGKNLPLLIALHGYAGDMTSMMRVAREIALQDMAVVSLQGPHQFWVPSVEQVATRKVGFGWLTNYRAEDSQRRHHQVVTDLIARAGGELDTDVRRVFLLGFSQACALNYRFAFTFPKLLRGVIGVCGGIPGDFLEDKYKNFNGSVLHIAAKRDQYYATQKTRSFRDALCRHCDDVSYREYDSTHVFPRRSIPLIRKWILARC